MFSEEFLPSAQATDLRVGLNMGAWETVITRKPNSAGASSFNWGGKDWTVTFRKATMSHNAIKGDSTQVLVTSVYTYGQWHKRLVAVANDGSEHVTRLSNDKDGSAGTVVFHDLPLSSIKEFRFQVRPYRWVEFQNVALQPGQKMNVQVVSPDASVSKEK
jgi:hypothetical protein